MYRMNPNLTTAHFSALAAYMRNNTAAFMKKYFKAEDYAHIRRLGRPRNASGGAKKFRQRLIEVKRNKIMKKLATIRQRGQEKLDKLAKLRAAEVVLDEQDLRKLKVAEMDVQLRIHRDILQTEGLPKPFKLMKNREDKLHALIAAINQHKRCVVFLF